MPKVLNSGDTICFPISGELFDAFNHAGLLVVSSDGIAGTTCHDDEGNEWIEAVLVVSPNTKSTQARGNYKIVRMFYQDDKQPRTLAKGLTLAQAQAHCKDPETSSKTATSKAARDCTKRNGPWFDVYEEEA